MNQLFEVLGKWKNGKIGLSKPIKATGLCVSIGAATSGVSGSVSATISGPDGSSSTFDLDAVAGGASVQSLGFQLEALMAQQGVGVGGTGQGGDDNDVDGQFQY